jgi:hypothetical protein
MQRGWLVAVEQVRELPRPIDRDEIPLDMRRGHA